jgi:Na+/H+ antiporter NhaD/arsenite permease-like protein
MKVKNMKDGNHPGFWKMNNVSMIFAGFFLIASIIYMIIGVDAASGAAQSENGYLLSGRVYDPQGNALALVRVTISEGPSSAILAEVESQENGEWTILLEDLPSDSLTLSIERPHFKEYKIQLETEIVQRLRQAGAIRIDDVTLERKITAAFWTATVIFVLVLLLIAFEKLHSTTAALTGLSAIFIVNFVGGTITPDLFIFDFERAISFINWDVIFLVMAMMIIIAIIESTGIFQWMAFQAYRLSRGHSWLLALILMLITALASALLDNFTTMLLMAPISLQIGLALGINPLALIIPEVLASNIGGITTLIGTPTNILIGAYAGIGFSDFLKFQTVGVVIALLGMAGFVLYFYRAEWRKHTGGISPRLYEVLKENARLEDPSSLWKASLVFILVIVGFIVGEKYHVNVAVTALVGATVLLIWLKPDIHAMIKAVDWTTLVFFMALFIVVGAIQEVGLLAFIATGMARLIGNNLELGVLLIVFGVGTLSTAIANIPLTASMLPIIKFLSKSIPGANNQVLYYALSMGAAMGGNGLLIGAEANLVTAGITDQAGTPISFKEFLKIGLPVTYITLATGFLWLLLRF